MLERAVERIVGKLVEGAPVGWSEASIYGTVGRGGARCSGGYEVPGAQDRRHRLPQVFRELLALAEELRLVRGWEPASLAITCRPPGAYSLVASMGDLHSLAGRGNGFRAVLDHSVKLEQPGLTQARGAGGPAGDAQLAVERFHRYTRRRGEILGREERLPPPVSGTALEEAERMLSRRLPGDLRALYQICDGGGEGSSGCLFGRYRWLPIKSVAACNAEQGEPFWFGWARVWDQVVFDAEPFETVRRCTAHPGWVPFASGGDGNYLAVDMAPARNGHPGQVIAIGRDYRDGPVLIASSLTALLGCYLESLERGAYEFDDEYLIVQDPPIGRGPVELVVDEVPDTLGLSLQAIHINDATSPVELSRLGAAGNLRLVHLNRCATADLEPLRSLPIETLRVTLSGGDLSPLAHHRHLAALSLGSAIPLDLSPLTTVSTLTALDLADAEIGDLSVVAELPGLRYLAMTPNQWATLLESASAPPALGAASLIGKNLPFDLALNWGARLGLDNTGVVRTSGVLGNNT